MPGGGISKQGRRRGAPREAILRMKSSRRVLKHLIRRAFADTPRPDNSSLRDSDEGDEPFLVEEEFWDKQDWRTLDAGFLTDLPPEWALR
jgi:hypothetical protein